jgi:UDP-GlcNAc:undecaprenyl-phosphate/decaprenyl-phosphate GlcNAc-1-phosphate transferase
MQATGLQYFLLFFATFALVGTLTPVMRKIAISKKIYDLPNAAHKTHKEPVPYLGGVAIIIGVTVISYAAAIYKNFNKEDFLLLTSVLAPAIILGLIGLWDDLRNLRPGPRLAIQTVAGIFTAYILISQDTVGNPTGSQTLDAIITVVWIVGICNSINFFDNVDGGAAGTVAISSLGLFYLTFQNQQFFIAALSSVTAGATIGFLLWNKSPARIYMGDAGALFLGVLIATLTIRLQPDTDSLWKSLATPILLLAVPILDTTTVVISRIKRGVSPLQGGNDHLSHRLISRGMPRKQAVVLLWSISAILCTFTILLS